MTFSVKQRDAVNPRIIGTLWAGDEALARALAALFFPSDAQASLIIQRAEDREIPMRFDVEPEPFH
jgi:hypothetical protein